MAKEYGIVGCKDCDNLSILEVGDPPDSTECIQCGKRRKFSKLRVLTRSNDKEIIREELAERNAEKRDGERGDTSFTSAAPEG